MSPHDGSRLEIPRPRVIWAERGDPDAVSAGDEACLSFPAGLLRFLEADLGGGLTPGAGFAPRWILPLAAAASASYYAASPRGRETLNGWTATRARLVWARACGDGEVVEARARIVRMGRASVRLAWRVESAARRDLLAEGELILVSRDAFGAKRPVLRLHEQAAPAAAESETRPPAALERGPDATLSRTRARRWWPLPAVRGLAARLGRRCREGLRARRTREGSAPCLEPTPAALALAAGQSAIVTVRAGSLPAGLPAEVSAELPGGHGLAFAWRSDPRLRPPHTRSRLLEGIVTALRPDEVNVGAPWVLRFHLAVCGERVRTAAVSVGVPDPLPAEVYYVPGGRCRPRGARTLATTADDLLAPARALFAHGRGDDLWLAPARCDLASQAERSASFERRLAECGGPGVRVVRASGDGDDLDRHLRYVRALHPQVHMATATEAVLGFLDYYSPHALAAALPPSHVRGDGLLWRHPVRILGRGIPITPQQTHAVQLPAAWWEPGDVREMAVLREGAVVARRALGGDEPPIIEFLAEDHAGYELRIELHETALARATLRAPARPPAPQRSPAADAGRFHEWPGDPVELLAAFEAPFLLGACRAHPGSTTAGDSWSWVYPPRLLRLLYSPIGGGTEPLGRRAHPLGAIAAAAAVHAATEGLGGGWRPLRVAVRWRRPIDPQSGFLLHLRVCRCDAEEIDLESRLEQPPAALADVSLTLRAASADGGA